MKHLVFKPDGLKFLGKLEPKHFKQVAGKIFALPANPMPQDSLMIEAGIYRVDIGEYRVIYEFDDIVVRILAVGKRNDDEVYRRFRRSQQ